MSRSGKTRYATALSAAVLMSTVAFGGVAFGGVAYASDDDNSGSGGTSHRGADGKDGQATAQCNQKLNMELANPLQCAQNPKSTKAHGDKEPDGVHSSHGKNGADGTATHNRETTD